MRNPVRSRRVRAHPRGGYRSSRAVGKRLVVRLSNVSLPYRNVSMAPGHGGLLMRALDLQVLEMFREMNSERLDLHTLFEAAGNRPSERIEVLDAVQGLTREGFVTALGGDFYGLT